MNTGIQDGYNLAWKIWLALRGKGDAVKILETYNEERLENAKNLLETTDRMFELAVSPKWFISYLRTNIFPYIARFAFSIDAVKKFAFPRVSQIGINYRGSSLSENNGKFSVKAGDRMPYFTVEGASIYDRLHQPKFHLITFFDGSGNPPDFPETEFSELMDFHHLPLYPHIAKIFGSNKSFMLLLRPYNYIGFISAEISAEILKRYLSNIIG